MDIKLITVFALMSISIKVICQQPKYTVKSFVKEIDTLEFKYSNPIKNGFIRTYIPVPSTEIWDIDDDSTTYIRLGYSVTVCYEGNLENDKKEGLFKAYLIDSADHSKRYKIWEQNYHKGKMNGEWRTYTLRGTLVNSLSFKNDSLNGISKFYWIDGKTVTEERKYFNG